MKRFALLCALSVCLLAPPSQAQTAPQLASVAAAVDSAGAQGLTSSDVKELLKLALQPRAQVAPALAAATSSPASISADGVFGFSWAQVAGFVGTLLALLFGVFKGAGWLKARAVIGDCIAASFWIIERNFAELPGPAKTAMALGELYKALEGHGIPLDPKIGAQAMTAYALQAAKSGAEAPAPVAVETLADARAKADAAAKVADAGKTATDLAAEARAP